MKRNFNLVTTAAPLIRHAFEPAQESLLWTDNETPSATNPKYLLDGEWLSMNDDYKAAREGAASNTAGGSGALDPTAEHSVSKTLWYPYWLEPGRSDARGIAGGRVSLILGGACYEVDLTESILAAADVSGGFSVGDKLYVNWAEAGSNINRRRVLTKILHANDVSKAPIHAFVTRVYPAGSTYKIRALIK